MTYKIIPADEVGLVNCAQCDKELLGEQTWAKLCSGKFKLAKGAVEPPPVYMRAGGRPYCLGCSVTRESQDRRVFRTSPAKEFKVDDIIKAFEGD